MLVQSVNGIYIIIEYGKKVKSQYSPWGVYGLLGEVAEHWLAHVQ